MPIALLIVLCDGGMNLEQNHNHQ